MKDVAATIAERELTYGLYKGASLISQNIKRAFKASPNWEKLAPFQQESMEMAANKLGRILNGDYNHKDSWHDVAGYFKLVEDNLSDKR